MTTMAFLDVEINHNMVERYFWVLLGFSPSLVNLMSLIFRRQIKTPMQMKPRRVSANRVSWMLVQTLEMVSMKPLGLILSPRRLLIWEAAIITDVAEVKPTVTGMEMKSMRTPKRVKFG